MKKLALVGLCLVLFAGISSSAQPQVITTQTETTSYYAKPQVITTKAETTSIGKFAVGYSQIPVPGDNTDTNNVPSFAGRYWFNENMGIDVTIGFQSGDGDDICLVGGKFLGKLYTIKNLDIYCLAGLQFGTVSVYNGNGGTSSETAFRLMGGFGAEYFILPCLSVLTEVGLCFETVNSDPNFSQFKTFAEWLPQAGVRFYFSKI
ncbi:MAG: outer membrane beta-barrel protein [Endomicrobiaceae bacterium]|nr:outer membrane beta-barrel protein [Endomicrobiaceae bacterium]